MRSALLGLVILVVAAAGALAVAAPPERSGRVPEPRPRASPPGPEAASPRSPARRVVAGRSVRGRALVATRRGQDDAPVRVLAIGSIHGSETAGHAIVRRLRGSRPPAGVAVWTVLSANPDGAARATRHNARGVDLNRNFPLRWRQRGGRFEANFSGPRPGSEPETRALMRLLRRLRPDVTVFYHQALALVNRSAGADTAPIRAYAARAELPVRTLPRYRGTAAEWQNEAVPGTSAFVVELPAGRLGTDAVARHAAAVIVSARTATERP